MTDPGKRLCTQCRPDVCGCTLDHGSFSVLVRGMGQYLTFRIVCKLPANVVGPHTRWIVFLDYYGKNGCKAAVIARCLTNGASVTLLDGREGYVSGAVRSGLQAKIGSIQCKLLTAMVAQGNAEILDTTADGWECGIFRGR